MSLPDLDPEERRAALAKATEARRIRAELKQMLKVGEVTPAQVIDRADSDDRLGRMRVAELIQALPNMGPTKCRRLMEELDIAPSRRLQGLGSRQRAELVERLAPRVP